MTEEPLVVVCGTDYRLVEEGELVRIRAMLPQRVEGLPTEPGWYWVQRKNGEWVLLEVYLGWTKQILGTVDGREHAEPIEEFHSLAPFYGPLTPPDHIGEPNEMIDHIPGAGKKVE